MSTTTRRIKCFEMGIMSPEVIRENSVLKITTHETMDKNQPKPGGLADPIMGTTTRGTACGTCGFAMEDDPGHFGHIDLARPVVNPVHVDSTMAVLRATCRQCSRLLADIPEATRRHLLMMRPNVRASRVFDLVSTSKQTGLCPHCEAPNFRVNVDSGHFLELAVPKAIARKSSPGCAIFTGVMRKRKAAAAALADDEGDEGDDEGGGNDAKKAKAAPPVNLMVSPEQVLARLERVTDEEAALMGFHPTRARPEWMVLRALPVPPPSLRPTVVTDDASRGDDNLTKCLVEIFKANTEVEAAVRNRIPSHVAEDAYTKLNTSIGGYMLNDKAVASANSGGAAGGRSTNAQKAIESKLKTKDGHFRGALCGKRVNRSARTVITPDPDIPLHWLAVPRQFAMTLTFEEHANVRNLAELQEMVDNGPSHPLGASLLRKADGSEVEIRTAKPWQKTVEPGDVVHRFMRDGDHVIFNRQPSLHKMSMMGHRVMIWDKNTFGMNTSVTTPYNADHDGDEMNMHLGQNDTIDNEIREIMMVTRNIVSPQANRPVIAMVQDTVLGLYLLTDPLERLARDEALLVCQHVQGFRGLCEPAEACPRTGEPLWTGHQIVSMALPRINVRAGGIVIEDGVLTPGSRLTKKSLGCVEGGIVHIMFNDLGGVATAYHIFALQKIATEFLMLRGSTVGMGDVIMPAPVRAEIKRIMDEKIEEATRARREGRVAAAREIMDAATTQVGRVALDAMGPNNGLKVEVESGAKGSILNQTQTTSALGTQHIHGGPFQIGPRERLLPHFDYDDPRPIAHGYVADSFITGLHPACFFAHNQAGREGLIDTAVRTSDTGYLQRRLGKAMTDQRVTDENTVATSDGRIIQFRYGSDGFDATGMERQRIPALGAPLDEFRAVYEHDRSAFPPDSGDAALETARAEFARLLRAREVLLGAKVSDTLVMPVPVDRMVSNIMRDWDRDKGKDPECVDFERRDPALAGGDSTPAGIVRLIDVTHEALECLRHMGEPPESSFFCACRLLLASKRLCRVPFSAAKLLLDMVIDAYERSRVRCGEAVGALASQSIGEPSTQLTLNTFHSTGSVNKTVSHGVPRMTEILSVCRNTKTPFMHAFLRPPFNRSREAAQRAAIALQYTPLSMLIKRTQIVLDPVFQSPLHEEDRQWVEEWYAIEDEPDPQAWSRVAIRFELRKDVLDARCWTAATTCELLRDRFRDVDVIHSPDHEAQPVLRVRFRVTDAVATGGEGREVPEQMLARQIARAMRDEVFGGIRGVVAAEAEEVDVEEFDPVLGATRRSEWGVVCQGANMPALMCRPEIDQHRGVRCNDIVHVFEVRGIEVARAVIFSELWDILTMDGSQYINARHIMLLVDTMTQRGTIMPINRHGINRVPENTTFHKCSFEETLDMLVNAARYSYDNPVKGVVDNLILGQAIPVGTSHARVEMDLKALTEFAPPKVERAKPPFQKLFGDWEGWARDVSGPTSNGKRKQQQQQPVHEEAPSLPTTVIDGRGNVKKLKISVPFS